VHLLGVRLVHPTPTVIARNVSLGSKATLAVRNIILGPGEAAKAHQTDEYCPVQRIRDATDIYTRLAVAWRARSGFHLPARIVELRESMDSFDAAEPVRGREIDLSDSSTARPN
jgi:hypothetical protein